MHCNHCGKSVQEDSAFCVFCGKKIAQKIAEVRDTKNHRPMDRCQSCGIWAETKYVEFYQNIGVVVMRFHKSIKGNLCKRCINKYFWPYTLITIGVGWIGVISFLVAPFFVLNNIFRYLTSLGLKTPEN